ncbi:MAG: undecaprenyl-diphosphate phosphatase [Acidimicrobiales bacterium]
MLVAAHSPLSYLQAVVIGLLQGITELFPISSLGHSVLLPALLGWDTLVKGQSAKESFYLAFVVGLHCATALALLLFFRKDWVRIIKGGLTSLQHRRIETPDERLAWLLVVVSIPVGAIGLALEHTLRTIFAKPLAAAVFLFINGLILLGGERLRRADQVRELSTTPPRRSGAEQSVDDPPVGAVNRVQGRGASRELGTLSFAEAGIIGFFQSAALLAGISRSGVTMVGGLVRGLNNEDAARFSFLAATPIIFAAGVYKLPDLAGPNGHGILGQVLVGSVVSFLAAYMAVKFLVRFFERQTLVPFGIYCLVAGALCMIRFGLF